MLTRLKNENTARFAALFVAGATLPNLVVTSACFAGAAAVFRRGPAQL
jgi:hypothetical protein